MDMAGENRIAAPRQAVWEALNDPETLAKIIPGIESITRLADNSLEAVATQSIGPVKARFKGKVTFENVRAPESCTLRGEGSGGVAGFAKGEAQLKLEQDGAATILRYTVKATVGGKLAQIGQRLIDQAAKKIADEFFARFSALIAQSQTPAAPELTPAQSAPIASGGGLSAWVWVPLVIGAVLVLVFVFAML